jgi:hypothetical protein
MVRRWKAQRQVMTLQAPAWLRFIAFGGTMLAVCYGGAIADEPMVKSGTVRIEQIQLAFIGSGNLGGGTLQFQGNTYKFSIGGLGIGGFGVSKITAVGNVYNLTDPRFFPGAYVQGRYGYAVGEASAGKLWLKNSNGVVLELKAERQGLALSLGGDAVYINFD